MNALLACPARVYFDRITQAPSTSAGPASVIGTAVHAALERLVVTGEIWAKNVDARAREAWLDALAEIGAGTPPEVLRLPGFYVKQARLVRTASRLRRLLVGTELEAEVALASKDGLIRGRLDLAVRGASGVWILDYKSGIERDETGAGLVEPYARQLLLYAYLWHEQYGEWPSRTMLIPLDGPEIEIPVDPSRSVELAETARGQLAAFNRALPSHLVATPSASACRYCRHVLGCDEFSRQINSSWAPALLALAGFVIAVETAENGGRSLAIEVTAGSVAQIQVSLVRVDPRNHPAVAQVAAGDRLGVVGLYPIGREGVYGVRDTAVVTSAAQFS